MKQQSKNKPALGVGFMLYLNYKRSAVLHILRGDFMVYVNVMIQGQIDSKSLWEDVKGYDVNVTDMVEFTSVYGKVSMYDSMFIIDICRKYGDITSEVTSI